MALTRYETRNMQTVQSPISTGREQLANVETSGANMLAAELERFSASVIKVGDKVSNKLAAEAGTADALEAGLELNEKLTVLDEDIYKSIEQGDTGRAQELMQERAEAVSGASAKAQQGSWLNLDRIYNNSANKVFADQFEASLPALEIQARELSNDDPVQFRQVFKQYTDEMVKNAPNNDIAAYVAGTLVRKGSAISAELQLKDYQESKAMQSQSAQDALALRENDLVTLAGQVITDAYDPNVSPVDLSVKLGAEYGAYVKQLEGSVNAGVISEGTANLRLDTMRRKMDLAMYTSNAQAAIEDGNYIEFMESANPRGNALYMEKLDIANKLISNDLAMEAKFEKAEQDEIDEIHEARYNELVDNGRFLEMSDQEIFADPSLDGKDKISLVNLKKRNQEQNEVLGDYDPNIIYSLPDRNAIAGLPVSKAVKAQMYRNFDKYQAFKSNKALGLHTPQTKKLESEVIDDIKAYAFGADTDQLKRDLALPMEVMADIANVKKQAGILASQQNMTPEQMDTFYLQEVDKAYAQVFKTWADKKKQSVEVKKEIETLTKRQLELEKKAAEPSFIGGVASYVMNSSDTLNANAQRRAKAKAELKRVRKLIEEKRQKETQLGFGAR